VFLGTQGLLVVAMGVAGSAKLVGTESEVEGFERFGYPQWFRLLIGVVELLGAAGLVAGILPSKTVALVAGGVIAIVMVGAMATLLRAGDPPSALIPVATVFVLSLVVIVYHAGVVS